MTHMTHMTHYDACFYKRLGGFSCHSRHLYSYVRHGASWLSQVFDLA